jgi:hypothetical protein
MHHEWSVPILQSRTSRLNWAPRRVTQGYHQRGTAEQRIKEGRSALNWTRLSCHEFAENQARLQRFALAYNPDSFLCQLALPRSVSHYSLRTLQARLIKIGTKVVQHSVHTCFQLMEVSVPR